MSVLPSEEEGRRGRRAESYLRDFGVDVMAKGFSLGWSSRHPQRTASSMVMVRNSDRVGSSRGLGRGRRAPRGAALRELSRRLVCLERPPTYRGFFENGDLVRIEVAMSRAR